MNDSKDLSAEDRAIEQAWDQVASGEPRLARDGEADAERVREYTELLGLLPYGLEPEAPPPRVKDRIMAQVAAAAGGETSDAAASQVVPFTRPAARPAPAPRSFWRFAQAAVLAASLAGVVFLGATVREQSLQIARLSERVAAAGAVDPDEVVRIRQEVETYRSRLNMVTTVARYAYPMHTVSAVGSGQKPQGIVYVCGAHRQWYLSLRGLEPPPEGAEYRLWFMTDGDKIDGGVLDVRAGASIEMEDVRLPDGTHGFAVTLEKQDTPESLTILLGDDVVNL